MTRTTTTVAIVTCEGCGHDTIGSPDGTVTTHRDLRGWPRDRGIGAAPLCLGITGKVVETRTTTYDDATGHYRTVTLRG